MRSKLCATRARTNRRNWKAHGWPIWEKEESEFPWNRDAQETCYSLEVDEIVTPGDQITYRAEIDTISPDAAATSRVVLKNGDPIGQVNLMFSHIAQNLAGTKFPEENFVFTGQFERLIRPFLERADG